MDILKSWYIRQILQPDSESVEKITYVNYIKMRFSQIFIMFGVWQKKSAHRNAILTLDSYLAPQNT